MIVELLKSEDLKSYKELIDECFDSCNNLKQYAIDWLSFDFQPCFIIFNVAVSLLVTWSIVILSGIPTIGFAISENERLFAFSRIHGVSIRLGCILIIIHISTHRSCFVLSP